MTDEFESRLRLHLRVVDDVEVASTADVASSARRFAVRRRRRNRAAAGAASLVAVVVAGSAVVAVLPGGSGEVSIDSSPDDLAPATTPPAATSPAATSSTVVTTTSPPADAETSAWVALPPDPRGVTSSPSVVWTGTEAIAIGGLDDNGDPRISAAAFDPATDTWRTLQDPPIDNPVVAAQFINQLVVWTGTEVLVLGGGSDGPRRLIALGGHSYDPATDEWRSIPIPFPTGPVSAHTPSVWTGTELLVWTTRGSAADAGAATAFDPVTDTWRELAAPPAVQREHAASVWTGTEWIIWGGHRDGADLDDGVAYNPATDTWRTIADSPLSPRRSPAVWTGAEMLTVSGSSGNQESPHALADGAAYDPVTDSWRPIADGYAHPGFVPVWTGTHLVLFAKGGAVVYDPATDRWIDTCCNDTGGGPGGTPVWTGSTIVLLGSHHTTVGGSTFSPHTTQTASGDQDAPSDLAPANTANIEDRPDPSTDAARLSVKENGDAGPFVALGELDEPTGLSIGNDVLVVDDDATYVLDTDSLTWRRAADPPTPVVFDDGAIVWTGSELLLWGAALERGLAYSAESDGWRVLPEAPIEPRVPNVSGFIDGEFFVWGGVRFDDPTEPAEDSPTAQTVRHFDDAAAYDPTSDTWRRLTSVAPGDGAERIWTLADGTHATVFRTPDGDLQAATYDPTSDRWTVDDTTIPGGWDMSTVDAGADLITLVSTRPAPFDSAVPVLWRWNPEQGWQELPTHPFGKSPAICSNQLHEIDQAIVVWWCDQIALLDDENWSTPIPLEHGLFIRTDDGLVRATSDTIFKITVERS